MATAAGDVIVERLIGRGVDTAFGLPDGGINGMVEVLRGDKDRIRFIQRRYEEAVAFAACGHARFTGRLGVCFATTSPDARVRPALQAASSRNRPVIAEEVVDPFEPPMPAATPQQDHLLGRRGQCEGTGLIGSRLEAPGPCPPE